MLGSPFNDTMMPSDVARNFKPGGGGGGELQTRNAIKKTQAYFCHKTTSKEEGRQWHNAPLHKKYAAVDIVFMLSESELCFALILIRRHSDKHNSTSWFN